MPLLNSHRRGVWDVESVLLHLAVEAVNVQMDDEGKHGTKFPKEKTKKQRPDLKSLDAVPSE